MSSFPSHWLQCPFHLVLVSLMSLAPQIQTVFVAVSFSPCTSPPKRSNNMKSDNTDGQTVNNITSDVTRELTTIQPYCITCIQTQTHLYSQFSLTHFLKLFDVSFCHYGRHILQEFQHPCNVPIETQCYRMDSLLYKYIDVLCSLVSRLTHNDCIAALTCRSIVHDVV